MITLANIADLTTILSDMAADGHPVTPDLVASISPTIRGDILRCGQYALDMANMLCQLDRSRSP
jgi:hypothetical protein